ncbi:MAG: protein kinase [Planctomycetaceae bacterium]|nr:protein kinase [Planctomycetaceae bacterium]
MSSDSTNRPSPDRTEVLLAYDQTFIGMPMSPDALPEVDAPATAGSHAEQVLRNCRPFQVLTDNVRRAVAQDLEPVRFSANESLITQGVPGKGLWIIASGAVDVHVHGDLDRTVFISSVGPGDVLGEMSLLTQQPATASAVATGPTLAYLLPAATFHHLAQYYPSLCVVLTNVVASRLGTADLDVLAGKTLGGYLIRGRLGRGGMSIVYDAERLEDRLRAALKMMSHRLVYDREALESFQREADLIERFHHPHIVRLLGRFEAFHTYFIAMEFCDGDDLKSLIKLRGPFPAAEARPILGQLASALNYSHQAGVVHRDVKPSNIMRTQAGRILLMDFGLAKPTAELGIAKSAATGTPQYMPIEQLRGDPVNETADYFAFGCVAFELLMGRPLISANNAVALMDRHDDWSVPRILKVCSRLDAEFLDLLEGALQRESTERQLDLTAISKWADTDSVGHSPES